MSERPTQAVIAVIRMSGAQDVQVDASHPNTDNAAVVVRVGTSLLYLHELRTAEHLAEPWAQAAKLMKTLPMYSARDAVKPNTGMPDPAVITHASGKPTCQVNSVNDRGGQPFLRVPRGVGARSMRLATGLGVVRRWTHRIPAGVGRRECPRRDP